MTAALLEEIEQHRLDAALLALPVGGTGMTCEALFDEPFWVLAPAGHALAGRRALREQDLADEQVLLLTEGHCLREQALAICGEGRAAVGDDFRATSLEMLRHMVAAGFGLTLLPALAVPALATTATLAARPFRAPGPHRRIGLVWRKTFPRPDALRALAAFVRGKLPEAVRVCDGRGDTGSLRRQSKRGV